MMLFVINIFCKVKYVSRSLLNEAIAEPLVFSKTDLKETFTNLDEHLLNERLYIRPYYDHEKFLGVDVNDYIEAVPGKPVGGNIKLTAAQHSGYFMYVDNKQVCHKENHKLGFCSREPNLAPIIQFIKVNNGWLISSGADTTSDSACLTLFLEEEKDALEFRFCDGSHHQVFEILTFPNMKKDKFDHKSPEFDMFKEELFGHC